MRTILPFCCLALAWALTCQNRSHGGSPVYVGTKASADISMDSVDHSLWNQLLTKYVDGEGMVDYRSWRANRQDIMLLDQYLQTLSSASERVHATKQAKLAFWINAYNAATIRGILREYPTTSIRNHTARLFGYNIWKDLKLYVGGTPISLHDIEHERLRTMSEPRIHFAIVCASISCPRLLNEAYLPDRVDQQLESNAKDFFSRQRNFRFDRSQQRFELSSILKWFAEDFGSNQSAQLKRIADWLPSKESQRIASLGKGNITYLDYDWGLNSQ